VVKTTASIHWLLTHLYQAMTAALTQIDKYLFSFAFTGRNHTGSSLADLNHGFVVCHQVSQGCQEIQKYILQINLLS